MNGHKIGSARFSLAAGVWIAAATGLGLPAHAGIIWNESVNGDLADLDDFSLASDGSRAAITHIGDLTAEISTVVGRSARATANSISTVDGDAVRFTIPAGMAATVLAFTHDRPLGVREFLRIDSADVPVDYFLARVYPPLTLPGGSQNLLSQFDLTEGLPSGDYILSFENGDTANSTMGYGIDIVIAPIPTPAGAVPLGLMGSLVCMCRRGRP